VLRATRDPRLTVELNRFNLECNLRHGPFSGRPFGALQGEFEGSLRELERAAAELGGRVVQVGILPTLRESDLGAEGMTPSPRYRALSAALRGLRQGPFRLRIHGHEDLEARSDDVTFEGAATALQIHLRVPPTGFAALHDAVQLATVPALAAGGNSPLLLGRVLWEETRIALIKQAVDDRGEEPRREREARVSFGRGWSHRGVHPLFSECVELHPALLPIVDDEAPLAALGAGRLPALRELRLHQGTVWSWNRPIYDPAEGGHLRLEMRALPSGPTVVDMLANAAFMLGLGLGLAPEIETWRSVIPFADVHHNFYRAAQFGLDAELRWPAQDGSGVAPIRAGALVERLLDLAQTGLDRAGVDRSDSAPLLAVMAARAASGRTGARWQRRALARLERSRPRDEALVALVEHYVARSREGAPVHEWSDPEA
jgi:hypothetical protein